MANLTRKEILRVFYRATMLAIGMDPDKAYGTEKPPVRISYPGEGQPDWTVEDDVIFLSYSDVSGDETTQPVHEEWKDSGKDLIRRHFTNRVLQISFVAYGPNGYDNLLKIRHAFLDGSSILRKADLMILPGADTPQYMPELYQNAWFSRADMSLRFNNTMTWDEDVRAIAQVPVTIHDNPAGTDRNHDTGIIIKKG